MREMDKGREKRKRVDKEGEEESKREVKAKDETEVATEEEVEEFFAILKRMQVAAKYFGKGNGEGWRAAVEAEVAAAVGGRGDDKKEVVIKKGEAAEVKGMAVVEEETVNLDLNVTPEVEDNGV